MLPGYGIPDLVFDVVDAGFTGKLAYFVRQQILNYEPLVEDAQAFPGLLVNDEFTPGLTTNQQIAAISVVYKIAGQAGTRNLVYPVWQLAPGN